MSSSKSRTETSSKAKDLTAAAAVCDFMIMYRRVTIVGDSSHLKLSPLQHAVSSMGAGEGGAAVDVDPMLYMTRICEAGRFDTGPFPDVIKTADK